MFWWVLCCLESFAFLSLTGIFGIYVIQLHSYIRYITYFMPLLSTALYYDSSVFISHKIDTKQIRYFAQTKILFH